MKKVNKKGMKTSQWKKGIKTKWERTKKKQWMRKGTKNGMKDSECKRNENE